MAPSYAATRSPFYFAIDTTKRQQHNLDQYFKEHSDQLRKAYFEANRNRDRAQQKDIRNAWKNLQDAKDRMRPFFNNASGELKRQSVLILVRASRTQQKRQARKQNRIATKDTYQPSRFNLATWPNVGDHSPAIFRT
jgi:hypothetical protein